MNNDQGYRLNKVLKIIGYTVSGAVTWFYITRWLTFLIEPKGGDDVIAVGIILGIFWPIITLIFVNNFYRLCHWIITGVDKGLLNLDD